MEGSITYTCSECKETKTEVIPKKTEGCSTEHVHDWKEVSRVEPTCETPGSVTYKCEADGETKTEEIPAKGHDWKEESRVEASCEGPGSITYKCSICGNEKTEAIPQKTDGCSGTEPETPNTDNSQTEDNQNGEPTTGFIFPNQFFNLARKNL